MNNDVRREVYLRDRSVPTPAQARRLRHRQNAELAVVRRPSRIRRRFEAQEQRKLAARVTGIASFLQWRKAGRPKPIAEPAQVAVEAVPEEQAS